MARLAVRCVQWLARRDCAAQSDALGARDNGERCARSLRGAYVEGFLALWHPQGLRYQRRLCSCRDAAVLERLVETNGHAGVALTSRSEEPLPDYATAGSRCKMPSIAASLSRNSRRSTMASMAPLSIRNSLR